jgi:phosphoserine aminotransferase
MPNGRPRSLAGPQSETGSAKPHQIFISREEAPIVSTPFPSAEATVHGLKRSFNFNAGPGALPVPVLERVREELLDYRGTGMSVMEMSHRSPEFEEIIARAEATLRKLMAIPPEYGVAFFQGGGSMQFTMVPMNLFVAGKPVDVLHTGMWTAKAIAELKKGTPFRLAATSEPEKFRRIPKPEEISFAPDASYVYMATNNTIEGTQWSSPPDTGDVPLVADMSSDILSRPVDVSDFGLIFAGAQKNMGPSGITVVIVRRDLAERASTNLPTLLQYRTEIKEKSLYHTPPTFAVYITGLVLEWLEAQGGVAAIEKKNKAKAKLFYEAIDSSGGYYVCPVEKDSRSKMNVVFRVAGGDEAREKEFAGEAAAAGLVGLAGHRSVGGMRASIYNAVTIEAVEALVSFMKEFQKKKG